MSVVTLPSGTDVVDATSTSDPLVMVVGSDLDAVADVAGDLEAWGHDPIVHFDTDGLPTTIARIRPDVIVVVDDRLIAARALVGQVGTSRVIAYLDGGVVPVAIPAGLGIASTPEALRRFVEGGDDPATDPAISETTSVAVPIAEASSARSRGAVAAGPAAWVRVLVAAAVLVIVASLIFAPPSEELDVTDDAPAQAADVSDAGETIDVASLAIPTVAPEAPMAATPASVAAAGRSGFGGVVVLSDGGAPVADVRLVVTGPSGTLETQSDADGRWRVANVRGGTYSIVATSPGKGGAPLQVLVGEGQVINGVRVVLGGGAPAP